MKITKNYTIKLDQRELVGYEWVSPKEALKRKDVLAKDLGSGSRQNVVKATLNALAKLRTANQLAKMRGKTVKQLVGKVEDNAETK